jgi:hypothetical protein
VNTEDRFLGSFRQVEDARAMAAIVLVALDRYRSKNFQLFAFWETVMLNRHGAYGYCTGSSTSTGSPQTSQMYIIIVSNPGNSWRYPQCGHWTRGTGPVRSCFAFSTEIG